MSRDDIIRMAREAGFNHPRLETETDYSLLERFAALVAADERARFYGQDKPAECANSCPANQICDYCQIVEPVKEMIAAELRRLHEVNQELLEALRLLVDGIDAVGKRNGTVFSGFSIDQARAAIAKATGGQA